MEACVPQNTEWMLSLWLLSIFTKCNTFKPCHSPKWSSPVVYHHQCRGVYRIWCRSFDQISAQPWPTVPSDCNHGPEHLPGPSLTQCTGNTAAGIIIRANVLWKKTVFNASWQQCVTVSWSFGSQFAPLLLGEFPNGLDLFDAKGDFLGLWC